MPRLLLRTENSLIPVRVQTARKISALRTFGFSASRVYLLTPSAEAKVMIIPSSNAILSGESVGSKCLCTQNMARSTYEDTSKTEADIPKVIWVLWLQGFENAPKLIKKCVHTWENANENWRVIRLDERNVREYINIDDILEVNKENIGKSDISDIVRIKLLSKYGGVWVDSTCICQRPLDTWLHEYTTSGFFAFSEPTKDREIASWFLAAEKDNYLTNALRKNYVEYFRENKFYRQNTSLGRFVKMKLEGTLNINKSTSAVWFCYPVRRMLKVYPYFAFHYKFWETCRKDEKAHSVWIKTPKYSADGPLRPIRSGLTDTPCSELKEEVLNRQVPIYKLSWRIDLESVKENSTVEYILAKNKYINTE